MTSARRAGVAGWLVSALVAAWLPTTVEAAATGGKEAFPGGRGVRMVIPFPPGGGDDIFGRFLVNGLNEGFAPGSVADNRGGAGAGPLFQSPDRRRVHEVR